MASDLDRAGDDGAAITRVRLILSELEDADFDRIDPPSDLWARIEASIGSEPARSPKEPPSSGFAGSTVVEYWIDANDVVVDVGQDWSEFASHNDAPGLVAPPSHRTLWSYFAGDEEGELWRLVVGRVRRLRKGAEVPLRCDSADARRWFQMRIEPAANDMVQFRCTLVFEEARQPVSLLDLHSERDVDLDPVPLCGWCGRGRHGALWLDVEELVQVARLLERESLPPISQVICESCRDEMSAELLVPGAIGGSSV